MVKRRNIRVMRAGYHPKNWKEFVKSLDEKLGLKEGIGLRSVYRTWGVSGKRGNSQGILCWFELLNKSTGML